MRDILRTILDFMFIACLIGSIALGVMAWMAYNSGRSADERLGAVVPAMAAGVMFGIALIAGVIAAHLR